MNLQDLYQQAEKEDVDLDAAPSSQFELMEGETYIVTPERARNSGVNAKGTQEFGVMFRVLSGPSGENAVFWDNFYISNKDSEGAKKYNKRNFHYLEMCGLTIDVLASAEDEQTLTAACAGTKVEVLANYEKKKDGDGRWKRYHYSPPAAAARVVPEDDGPVELDF